MKTAILGIALQLVAGFSVCADVSLPPLFADNMVIQRSIKAPIWGWADPGKEVTVTASWGKSATAVAGPDRRWVVRLDTPEAGGPHTVEIKGSTSITLKNVLSGDVWVCSGQSNMEWHLNRTANATAEIARADFPGIRYFDVQNAGSPTIKKNYSGNWRVCTPQVVAKFAATAYYFGKEINRSQNIPIGLLSINWGGTRIEPWIPSVGFRAMPELKRELAEIERLDPTTELGNPVFKAYVAKLKAWIPEAEKCLNERKPLPLKPKKPEWSHKLWTHQNCTWTYNGMIAPILPFAIKGAIWYQGESNGGEDRKTYGAKMEALIRGWRNVWKQGDFPFYTVQLPNFGKSNPNLPAGGDGWARVRQAQLDTLSLPNTGVAVAIDLGSASNLHPKNKQDVGKRLAQWALARDYGQDIVPSGPVYKQLTVQGNQAVLSFDYVGSGLMVGKKEGLAPTVEDKAGKLSWFAISGADKKWHWAQAVIEGDTVIVTSPEVSTPVAVRYAYAMHPKGCNLYNRDGLAASPFTTEAK